MSFRWADYLSLARSILSQASALGEEASQRSAVSRAYYAAFCHARNYARDQHAYSPRYDSSDHRGIREYLARHRVGRTVCPKLNELMTWRQQCDYEDRVENLAQIASKAIQYAEDIIRILP